MSKVDTQSKASLVSLKKSFISPLNFLLEQSVTMYWIVWVVLPQPQAELSRNFHWYIEKVRLNLPWLVLTRFKNIHSWRGILKSSRGCVGSSTKSAFSSVRLFYAVHHSVIGLKLVRIRCWTVIQNGFLDFRRIRGVLQNIELFSRFCFATINNFFNYYCW